MPYLVFLIVHFYFYEFLQVDFKDDVQDIAVSVQVISKHGVDYIMTSMPAMHADLCGMTKMEAQMQYIKDVTAPPTAHNLHFYRLKKRKTDIIGTAWIGICPKGIEIYEVRHNMAGSSI